MSDMLFGLPAIGMLITGIGGFRACHSTVFRKQEPSEYISKSDLDLQAA